MDVVSSNLDYLLEGAKATVVLSVCAVVLAVALGAGAGVVRLYGPRWIRVVTALYIGLFRGTPVLVQMFFIFFGLPLLMGWNISAFAAATIALVLNNGAYLAEITRGGLQSLPRDQWSAGLALGLEFRQVLWSIIGPQALRQIVPPAVGQFTILIKDTSIASVIGYFELTKAGQHVVERTLAPFEIFTVVGLLYFIVCYSGTWTSRRLERRLAPVDDAGRRAWRYVLSLRRS
jgi:His/Glu/Gln/Arg/opine family amino acid ABC transporter permease subunit